MQQKSIYTLESAKEASRQNRLREWMIGYFETEGKNHKLVEYFKAVTDLVFEGPFEFPLDQMKPITGKPEEKLEWADENWDKHVDTMVEALKSGWIMPPLVITDCFGHPNALSDGNHRRGALIKSGYTKYWTIKFTNKKNS